MNFYDRFLDWFFFEFMDAMVPPLAVLYLVSTFFALVYIAFAFVVYLFS